MNCNCNCGKCSSSGLSKYTLKALSAKITDQESKQIAENIAFNFQSFNNSSAGLIQSTDTSTGTEFKLLKKGIYHFDWQIMIDGTEEDTNVNICLEVNGVKQLACSMPIVTGQLSGTDIVIVDTTPTIVKLINNSGQIIQTANIEGCQGNLVIISI